MNATLTQQHGSCLILVTNEVTGQRTKSISPQTVDEALQNNVDVKRAVKFAHCLDLETDYLDRKNIPLTVSVRHDQQTIIVHWHVVGDPESARDVWEKVTAGCWRFLDHDDYDIESDV